MEKYDIYHDISSRTGGDIYIGVVGPVRTGKSTFIARFMEKVVLPNISDKLSKQIATDEMPQSADGKMIMTTQPKFVPASAVKVKFKNKSTANVRLVDCVGYLVDGATGEKDGDRERLVKTPWSSEDIPFSKAAEIGTQKVIEDYSTVGVVVTTDGSIGEIPRENYEKAEERVIKELKELNKPFIVILNCTNPQSESAATLAEGLEAKYGVCVVCVNVAELDENGFSSVMEKILMEFPMLSVNVDIPKWMRALPADNSIIKELSEAIRQKSESVTKMKDFACFNDLFSDSENFSTATLSEIKAGEGVAEYTISAKDGLFYSVLSEECGESIADEYDLMNYIGSFSQNKNEFLKIKDALSEANQTGYGVVKPSVSDMTLDEPVLVKQGGKFGVRLKATAPSIHIVKVDVSTEVSPTVGTESQGEDLIKDLIGKYEENPSEIWQTNMLGKSLYELVGDGMTAKINAMPNDVKGKLKKTMTKIVNENKGGLICILL